MSPDTPRMRSAQIGTMGIAASRIGVSRIGVSLTFALVAAQGLHAQGVRPLPPAPVPPVSQPSATPAPADSATKAALPTGPQVGPPIRKIETAAALSAEPLGAISGVRQLSDGRVLLNDGTRRRLLLLDSALNTVGVVLDSLTDVENAYGTRAGTLLPYVGDSTLFVDAATYAMLVVDPSGRIARVRSVPRAQDVSYITNPNSYGVPGFDAKGRLVYRIPARPAPPSAPPPPNIPYIPQQPDSAFVVAVHLDTRKVDTLGALRTPKVTMIIRQSAEDGYSVSSTSSPLPLVDDWAVMPDGTIAFVRGRDYRVEFLNPDGTMTSSEKLPFPWVRLTEDDKNRFTDSLKALRTKASQNDFALQMIAWSNGLNKPYPANFTPPPGVTLPPGLPRDWILPKGMAFPSNYVYACAPGTTPTSAAGAAPPSAVAAAAAASAAAAGAAPPVAAASAGAPSCANNPYEGWYGSGYTPPAPTYRAPTIFPANELPDYRPPLPINAVRADADGNLWIRTVPMKPVPGGAVFDIVNRQGGLVDRIQLPVGYNLIGFGAGRVVYLTMRDAKGLHLAKVRLK